MLFMTILGKSIKSLQNVLNELSVAMGCELVTASAYSQLRRHLKHTAFIELNREVLVAYAAEAAQKRYQGFRLLAGDGSRIRLPEHPTTREQFGAIVTCNGQDATVTGDYLCGQGYVLYDVLNRIVIDGQLARSDAYEVDLAIAAVAYTNADDLLLYDRNFASYRFLATLVQRKRHFVIRCSSGSFAVAQQLFAADQETSCVVTLTAPSAKRKLLRAEGIPLTIRVRFVTVRLDTGELEILVTSLLDEQRYPRTAFKTIYNLRWGVETLYDVIKNRLSLENFSGKTAQAVLQDFHATLFLTTLESLLTQEADALLDERSQANQLGQTVNNMVSFHAIKLHAFRLLLSDQPPAALLDQLTKLFLMNPTYTRRNRDVPRHKTKLNSALNFHKRRRKHCF
jgi:Transposase DDE domain